ncbi:MAG: nuclear transport factor 2 family protein [Xanthomonadales bacterium]|nr:nuclear transport factor 2 family protein [Xanthomonadales bacterium]
MNRRSTRDVLADHLRLRQAGDVETDIARNYEPDCVLMTSYGVFHGHDGVREAARLLARQTGNGGYRYARQECHEELAFLEWSVDTPEVSVPDGADSYWIRDGRIRAMTIHYSVHEK